MKYEEIVKQYGKRIAKKIIEKMNGQTVGMDEDRSLDYYEWDVEKAALEIKTGNEAGEWD